MADPPFGTAVLRALEEVTDDAVCTTDLEGRITSWNPAAQRLFGFTPDQAIGQPIASLLRFDEVEEQRLIDAACRSEPCRDVDAIRRHRDGRRLPVTLTVAPLRDDEGRVVGTVRIARDASGSMQADRAARRLAAIVESSDDAIVSKDLNGIVMSWNAAAQRMFGYTADEMIGESIRKLIPADRQGEEDEVLARLRRGEKVDHFETLRQHKDGRLLPISLTVSPVVDGAGRVVGASKIARDISDKLAAEAERERLLAVAEANASAAQQASRLKDEFLATLSHELRTPLNAILGYSRMIRSGIVAPENQAKAIAAVERNAASLAQIVEDVLDVSRIISGKLRLHVEAVAFEDVIRHAVDAVKPAADAKSIRLHCNLAASVAPVSADAERLQQVVWNILSNAVKFTPRGGRVDVTLAQIVDNVQLVVSDTGIGITREFLPHIFERFRQQDSSTTRERGGLGLGLGIARQLVEMHGGTIDATSQGPGTGASFHIVLPAISAHANSDLRPAPGAAESMPLVSLATLHGVRVLVVDDDPDALAMVRDILEAAGAEVTVAPSASDALDLVGHVRPDVLVADLAMPRVDGFELIARVRGATDVAVRTVPAAAVTAYARSEDRIKALQSGFQLHLAKPIDPAALTAAVAELAHRDPDATPQI
jgi:PAS domain S-box-containing protein